MTRKEFLIELSNIDPDLPTHFHDLEFGLKPLNVVLEYTATTAILKWCVPGHAKKINVGNIQVRGESCCEIWIDKMSSNHRKTAEALGIFGLVREYEDVMGSKFKDHRLSDARRYKIEAMRQTVDWLDTIEEFTRKAATQVAKSSSDVHA